MKKLLFPFVLLLFAVAVQAQIQDPVKFNSELKICLLYTSPSPRDS